MFGVELFYVLQSYNESNLSFPLICYFIDGSIFDKCILVINLNTIRCRVNNFHNFSRCIVFPLAVGCPENELQWCNQTFYNEFSSYKLTYLAMHSSRQPRCAGLMWASDGLFSPHVGHAYGWRLWQGCAWMLDLWVVRFGCNLWPWQTRVQVPSCGCLRWRWFWWKA